MPKTNLLPLYSIQTNMVSADINPIDNTELLVLLATGKILTYQCDNKEDAKAIYDHLHYYPTNTPRSNNSITLKFEFTVKMLNPDSFFGML